jgi:hypothetical protein
MSSHQEASSGRLGRAYRLVRIKVSGKRKLSGRFKEMQFLEGLIPKRTLHTRIMMGPVGGDSGAEEKRPRRQSVSMYAGGQQLLEETEAVAHNAPHTEGKLVLVEGGRGMGRSTMVEHFLSVVSQPHRDCLVFSLQASAGDKNIPWIIMQKLVGQLISLRNFTGR